MVGTVAASGRNSLFMTGDKMSNLYQVLNENAQGGLKVVEDPYPEYKLFFRSDNVGFYERGIVAHSFSTCDMENIDHYHQKHDEIGLIDLNNLGQIVRNLSGTISSMMRKKDIYFRYH